jgi:Tfp pilus assembly protein PilZ
LTEITKKVHIKHPINVDNVDIHDDAFHPGAYVISLPLDEYPSYAWQTLFGLELWGSLDFWDRKVLIVGSELKLVTTLNNLQEKLNWLDQIVVMTNKRVDEHNRGVKAEKESKEIGLADQAAIRHELSTWSVRSARAAENR